MAWTTPKENWVAGDAVTATLLNNIGGNLATLKDPATSSFVLNQGADLTTTSTSFVNADATNLSLTITTTGGDVFVGFHANFTTGGNTYLDVTVDGVRTAGDDGIVAIQGAGSTAPGRPMSFVRLITGLSAGSHTFNLQWKTSTGTSTMHAGAGTANADLHPQFWVREIS